VANYSGKLYSVTPIKGNRTPLAAAYLNFSGAKLELSQLDPYLMGQINLDMSETGNAGVLRSAIAASSMAFSDLGALAGVFNISGTIGMSFSQTGRLRTMFKKDKTAPIKRLVVAGANQIWFEVI
jgi:hypothetical protein